MKERITALVCLGMLVASLALGAVLYHPAGDRDAAPNGTRVTLSSPHDRDYSDGTRVTLVSPYGDRD